MAISPIAPYEIPPEGHWPKCRADWAIDARRTALLVHDMQAYFLRAFVPGSSPLRPLLENVGRLLDVCRRADVPVFYSAQPGEQAAAERGLLADLWGPGIIEAPELDGIVESLRPRGGDTLISKRRYSAFFGTSLHQELCERGRDQLLVCGVYAHIGCLATALDAFMRDLQPFMVADAIADFSRFDHDVALRQVARTCGRVVTTRDVQQAARQLELPVDAGHASAEPSWT